TKARLPEHVSAATDDLKIGNLFRAAAGEKASRDALLDLSRLVAPPATALEVLRQAAQELDRAIADQKQLVEDTKQANAKDKAQMTQLEDRQAELVDKT